MAAKATSPAVQVATIVTATLGSVTDTETDIASAVEIYRSGDRKVQGAIRSELDKAMHAAVMGSDIDTAQFVQRLEASLKASKPAAAPVDYETLVRNRVATLELAARMIRDGSVVPSGIELEDDDAYEAMRQGIVFYDVATEDIATLEGFNEAATSLAATKLVGSGNRSSIADVVTKAFEGLESGAFLSVAEIANRANSPYTGPIAARLFPKADDGSIGATTLTDVVAATEVRGSRNVKGARKI